jgi:hypothetical protein
MQRDALERLSKAELIAFALFGNSGSKPNLITRLSQLITAGYKLGTLVCLQRDSCGPKLSAVPEGAQ